MGQRYNKNSKNWVFCYCSSNKTVMVQFFKSISPFSRMNFHNHLKNFEFLLSFYELLKEILQFLNERNALLMTTSSVFIISDNAISLWYSHLPVLLWQLSQSKSPLNQRLKPNVSELRKIATNSAYSELTLSETELNWAEFFSSEQRWCFSWSLNQRWKTSNIWNSAVHRWLILGLQPGTLWHWLLLHFHYPKKWLKIRNRE